MDISPRARTKTAEIPVKTWVRPNDPVADDLVIRWSQEIDKASESHSSWPGAGTLLDDFCDLASSDPSEMADFVARYGAPEVDGFEASAIEVRALRRYARGIAGARRVGAALVSGRFGSAKDWAVMLRAAKSRLPDAYEIDDLKLSRERYARWISTLFVETRVEPDAQWLGQSTRLAFVHSAGTFLAVIAILLAEEVGSEFEEVCDSCGKPVHRQRARVPGQGVFCKSAPCVRERERRIRARYRAKKRAEADAKGKNHETP